MINDSMSTEIEIRKEIMSLPPNRRGELLNWLIQGMPLLQQVKDDFRSGRCNRWK